VTAGQLNPPAYERTPNDSSDLYRYFNAKAAGLSRKSPNHPSFYTDKNLRLWTGTSYSDGEIAHAFGHLTLARMRDALAQIDRALAPVPPAAAIEPPRRPAAPFAVDHIIEFPARGAVVA